MPLGNVNMLSQIARRLRHSPDWACGRLDHELISARGGRPSSLVSEEDTLGDCPRSKSMCRQQQCTRQETQNLNLTSSKDRKHRHEIQIAPTHQLPSPLHPKKTHTKNPATLPNPNILPAHALPSSCFSGGNVSTTKALSALIAALIEKSIK